LEKSSKKIIRALEDVHEESPNVKRSDKRTADGANFKYVCIGHKNARFKPGIHFTRFFAKYKQTEFVLKDMAKKSEHLLYNELPSGYGTAIKEAKVVLDWKTLTERPKEHERTGIWAALASSVDYSAPQHTDVDFYISTFQCHNRNRMKKDAGRVTDNNDSSGYESDLPTAQYFVFAEFGLAFAFRPGDVFCFNPLYFHGCSAKTSAYDDEHVFVNAFYLKSMVVGGNDNKQAFTKLQDEWNERMLAEQKEMQPKKRQAK
jgi:hypothetical protein